MILFDLWSSSLTCRSALTHPLIFSRISTKNKSLVSSILQHPANEANRCAISKSQLNCQKMLQKRALKSRLCNTASRRNVFAVRVLTCGVCPFAFSFLDEAYTFFTDGVLLYPRELRCHQRSHKHQQDRRSQGALPFSSSASQVHVKWVEICDWGF